MESFEALSDRIAARYAAGSFENALDDLDRRASDHPGHVADLAFFRACLVSLVGRPAEAVETLRAGLDRGCWWAEPMLLDDPDLEAARAVHGFDAVAEESGVRWRASFAGEVVTPVVAEPSGRPRAVIVVMQGGLRATAEDVLDAWRPATDQGCEVIVPGCGQPITSDAPDRRNWFELEATDRAVAAAVSHNSTTSDLPLVLAGFSAGGRQALRIGLGRSFDVGAILLLAPAVRGYDLSPSAVSGAARRGVRVLAWIGSEDPLVPDVTQLIEALQAGGVATNHEVIRGLGHRVPDDLASRLGGALAFLLGEAR